MDEITAAFNILKTGFPGYEDRPQQVEMAREVFACLTNNERLIVEAGTGVGKSFAYLIPAILSNEKTIVSTASIALQEQLVKKDLVYLQEALSHEFSFEILKGKNNYLCIKREKEFQPGLDESYNKFLKWSSETETGDKDELHFIPDFWSSVSGDSNDCSAGQCPHFGDCFYYSHFRELWKKDIIVVNHHLLVYDLVSDFNLLPFHGRLIIDEAHQFENIISHVLGSALTHQRVVWLLYRLRKLKISVDHIFKIADQFFQRADFLYQNVSPLPAAVVDGLNNLKEVLSLDNVVKRLTALQESDEDAEKKEKISTTINYVNALEHDIDDFIRQDDENKVYYISGNRKFIELKSNVIDSHKPFQGLVSSYDSVIMTSATLTTGTKFDFIKERLGINVPSHGSAAGFKEMVLGSPFDYRKQALLYIDTKLPSPVKQSSEAFQKESVSVIEELIQASAGRALVLFTSYKHLRFAAEHLSIDYPFKSQGDMPPVKLIRWMQKTPNSVLLATATFWHGIDIRGEDLSMVVIVKLPFGSPGDPVYDERCRRLNERWFTGLALPSAILQLKQGFGRLIRSSDDYGVIAILDSRLIKSSYGRTIVSSLPKMNTVHDIEDVRNFYADVPVSLKQKKPRRLKKK